MTALVGLTVFSGIILAEFSLTTTPSNLSRYSPFLTPPLALLALVLMSMPSDLPTSAPWSLALRDLGLRIFPAQTDFGRTYGSVGGILLVFAIIISPHARGLLSSQPLTMLGKISFPIYLLHGTFVRSLFAWIMFGGKGLAEIEERQADGTVVKFERIPLPGMLRTVVAVAVTLGAVLVASYFWAERIEPLFGKITKYAETTMMGKAEGNREDSTPLPVRKE